MRAIKNSFTSPVRALATGTWLALFSVLTLCLFAPTAKAGSTTPPPIVVSGAPVQIGTVSGWGGSQAGLGGTFAVGPNGDVITGNGYSSNTSLIVPGAATNTTFATIAGTASTTDSYGNVYIGGYYSSNIYKIPYNSATATYTGFTATPTANCKGGTLDTAPCVFAPGVTIGGYAGLAFDAQGNFFYSVGSVPSKNAATIWECNLACIASATGTPTLLFSDSNSMGPITIDPWGNIFFTDGGNNGGYTGAVSNLNELPLSSGSYASKATVLVTYTTKQNYNGLSGVAAASSGTVYFATNNDGIFALPNTQSGGPAVSGIYTASTQGGRAIEVDSKGNLYVMNYSGGDVMSFIPMNTLQVGTSALGAKATATANVIDNAASCTPTLTLAANEAGAPTTEFTAAVGSKCSATLGTGNGTFTQSILTTGAATTATLTFTPSLGGERSAAFTVADSANSASGTVTVTGIGQGPIASLDPGVWASFTTGFTSPTSVVGDWAGDLFVADAGAGKVFEIPTGKTTLTSIGTFTTPVDVALDANGNLYVADTGTNQVYEIVNAFTGTQGGFKAGTQSVVVSSSTTIGGVALSAPNGLAFGPDGVLYISDSKNMRVVTFNPVNGVLGLTQANSANGLKAPVGVAVDGSGNLYVADPTVGSVFIFNPTTGFSTVTVGGSSPIASPVGVAVEPNGSLLIADKVTGSIVRVPMVSGALSVSSAYLIEQNPQSAQSLSVDAGGDIYTADVSGKAVYAIDRYAASINFGLVSDNQTSSIPVNLSNFGNAAGSIASLTQPANALFTLSLGSGSAACKTGNYAGGTYCQLAAVFSPVTASGTSSQTGSGTVNFGAPSSGSATIYLSGSTTTSNILQQTITGFSPKTPLLAGQQITLSATGGASGNPVTFSIDALSPCATCASVSGNVLTTSAPGTVKVDASQAGGKASNGNTYGPATATATITINSAVASDAKAILVSQTQWFPKLISGGFTAGANPAGGSFAVNQQGNVYVGSQYGGDVEMYNPAKGTVVSFATISNPGGIAVDSKNNLYISHDYNSIILKVPYVNGAYAAVTDASAAPACTGTDTTLCQFASLGGATKAIYFDPAGNFWGVTVPSSTSSPAGASKIVECNAACQPAGTGTVVYSDVNAVSQIAVDPWGNLFFTDGAYSSASNFSNLSATSSNLYELPYSSGKFATTPVLLQTYTSSTPLGSYNNQLDGVAVGTDGTVYYATQNEGIFAVPNSQTSGPDVANQYAVAALGGKGIELDSNGTFWVMGYHGSGDSLGEAMVNQGLTIPTGQLFGAAVTNSATVVDNAASCSSTANLVFTSSNPEFSGTATKTCGSVAPTLFSKAIASSQYPATLSFQATATLAQTATLTVTDTNNGGIGTAAVSSFGSATPQNIAFTAPANTTSTYAPGLTITLAATGGGSGNPVTFTVDAASTGAGTLAGNVLTVTQAGTIVIDANQAAGANAGTYYMAATQAQLNLTVNQAPQTLTFLAPLTPVTYAPGLQFALSATPGITGNPVTFTVDSSSTATATINVNVLTVTGAGTLVIDANEAGNVNYAAATQQQQTVVVNQAAQAITFVPPSAPIHYVPNPVASVCSAAGVGVNVNCNQITLVATGGGSGKAVVFTVDKTSTASATISGTTLTFASVGNVVVDANQVSTTNYLAAPQVQETIAILAPLATQTITFANPGTLVAGTTFTLTATSSAGLPVSYTAAPSTVCTVSGSVVTAVAAGTCTVTALQPGDNAFFAMAAPVQQAFTVNPAGLIPAMTLSFSMSDLVLQKGSVGVTQLVINSGNNFAGTVNFTCTGAPSGYTCAVNPNPIFVPQGGSAATTVSISPSTSAATGSGHSRTYLPAASLAVALCFFGLRRRNRLQLLLLAVVALGGLGFVTGCVNSTNTTISGTTSTLTVTATSNGTTKSATMTVLVQ